MQSNRFRDRQKQQQTIVKPEGETVTESPVTVTESSMTSTVTYPQPTDEVLPDKDLIGRAPNITEEELLPKPKPEATIGIKLTGWDNVKVDINDPTDGQIVNIKTYKMINKVIIRKILDFKKASYHRSIK